MPSRFRKPGRPKGSTTFDSYSAQAFGSVLRTVREQADMSQEELSHLAEIHRSHLSKLERGLAQPTLHAVFKLAEALGMKPTRLVRLTIQAMSDEDDAG